MEEYKIETRIRQIVLELAQPSLNRVTDCLQKLQSTDQKIDELCKKVEIYEQSASHYQQNNQQKFTDLENLMQITKRLEIDAARQHNSIFQQIIQLRSATDQLKLDNQNQTTHQQYMTNAHLKQQNEIEICQKKQTESHEIFNQKIEEFFKDYYTFFVDCRNQVSQINKEYVLLNRELKAQGSHLDEFHKHAENQFSFNQGMNNRLDLLSNEINECVHKDMFQLQFGKEEEKRILQINQIRNQLEQSLLEFKTGQISILERISGLENYEIIYRNQLNLYEKEMNKHIEESQCVQRSTQQELYNLSVQINKLQNNVEQLEKTFNQSAELTMNTLQSKLKRDVILLNQNLEQFKSESQNQILRELKMSQEQVKQEIMNEQKNKLDDQSELLKEQLKSQILAEIQLIKEQQKALQSEVEVQVNILSTQQEQQQQQQQSQSQAQSQNVTQQKQDSQGLIEFPSILNNDQSRDAIQLEQCIRGSTSLQQYIISLSNPQGMRGGNVIQGNRIRLKSINSLPKVSEHDKITVLWDRITDQLDDIRTDIQILNEIREEGDQKFKLFETEYNLGMSKLEKNHSILLKLKSDVHNDLEYLNSQISILFREKENNCRQNKKIVQLISGNSEINFIILSNLLANQRDMNCKYQLNNEVILEIKQDQKAIYRGTQFEMEDLLKKGFLSLIQIWEKIELVDTKEMNPNSYFDMSIHKCSTTKGKNVNNNRNNTKNTIDIEKQKSIKCTTQTIVDDKQISDRPKASYRSVNCRGERKKNLTVQQILKQSLRSNSVHNSNEQLPKVVLKKQ